MPLVRVSNGGSEPFKVQWSGYANSSQYLTGNITLPQKLSEYKYVDISASGTAYASSTTAMLVLRLNDIGVYSRTQTGGTASYNGTLELANYNITSDFAISITHQWRGTLTATFHD